MENPYITQICLQTGASRREVLTEMMPPLRPMTFPCVIHGRTFESHDDYMNELYEFMNSNWTALAAYRQLSSSMFIFNFTFMTTLAIVSKLTKTGLSVWRFVECEDGSYFAFGGVKPACKQFTSIDDMRACYKNWCSYGYRPGIKKQPKSTLPVAIQQELAALV